MEVALYIVILLYVAPIFILIAGIIWALGDKKKDIEELEKNQEELDRY